MEPQDLEESDSPEARGGLWKRLKKGLQKTQSSLFGRLGAAIEGHAVVSEETLEQLEESLISADLGVETSLELVERIRTGIRSGRPNDALAVRDQLVDEISVLLLDAPPPPPLKTPRVSLIVGVNGAGKTTSIAKLAQRSLARGERPLLAAGDTFRAAAAEQLVVWGERLGVEVVRHQAGADPAAVVFDSLQAARARSVDHVIVDTAGRLHTKQPLMEELAKIGRVVEREAPEWQRLTVLVVDATNGQNALQQAKEFSKVVQIDGVVLTKLDGTAKGGMVVAIARDLRLPVLHLGVGEGAGDLVDFQARSFASALFELG